jgi:predicted amidohydrolase YtcJ
VRELVVRAAEVEGRRVDVRVVGHRVQEVAPSIEAASDATVLDAHGGALIPGLHDHHLHLLSLAAATRSLVLRSLDDVRVRHLELPPGRWIRAIGYHEAELGPLDRDRLDVLAPGRPVRVQHQSGAMWVLSSAALDQIGWSDHPDGRLLGADALLRDHAPSEDIDLAAVGALLAQFGVTGATDATPTERAADLELVAHSARIGALPQRLIMMTGPHLRVHLAPDLELGPVKLVVADHALPSVEELADGISMARSQGRAVAVHCVTRLALVLAIAAWDEMGAEDGDRVEHAAVVPPELESRLVDLGVTVVTQPSFVHTRGDRYRREVDPEDLPYLYPCGRLLAAGIPVAGSTDAPFGDPNPWRAIATAVERRTREGAPIGVGERVDVRTALELFLGPPEQPGGPPRRVVPGARADLCLLHVPLDDALADPSDELVSAVVCGGRLVVPPAAGG